jgi:hypothetical protein
MRSLRPVAAACAFLLTFADAASAQTILPPVEVGVGVDGSWIRNGGYLDEPVHSELIVALRVTWPFSSDLAFEGTFSAGEGIVSTDFEYRTKALYTLQVRHVVWHSAGAAVQAFATYGAAGIWRRVLTFDEFHIPLYAVAGGGLQWAVASRAALRVEGQGLAALAYAPVGGRVSVGLSLPLGRGYRTRPMSSSGGRCRP